MPTFMMSLNWTDQGIRAVKDSVPNGPNINVDFICAISAPRTLLKTTNQNIGVSSRIGCNCSS